MITGEFPVPSDHPNAELFERYLASEKPLDKVYEGLRAESYKTTLRLTGAVEIFSGGRLIGKVFHYETDDPELEKLLVASNAFKRPG